MRCFRICSLKETKDVLKQFKRKHRSEIRQLLQNPLKLILESSSVAYFIMRRRDRDKSFRSNNSQSLMSVFLIAPFDNQEITT